MSLTAYGVTRGLAALLGVWLLPAWLGRRRGLPPRTWEITFLPICASFYLGAILAGHFLRFGAIAGLDSLVRGDIYLQGGEGVAGILAAWLTTVLIWRKMKLGYGRILDAQDCMAAPMLLGLALLKVGCHFAGCCQGPPWSGPFTVRFPRGTPAFAEHVAAGWVAPTDPCTLPVLPAQLIEAGFMLALAFAFLALFLRGGCRGYLSYLMGLAICAWRLASESFLRGDGGRGTLGDSGFTLTQAMTALACLLLVFLAADVHRRRRILFPEGPGEGAEAAGPRLPAGGSPPGGERPRSAGRRFRRPGR